MTELKTDRFLRALARQPVDRTPVWMMRQAGRYLPEYRKIRNQAGDFMSLCKNTDLACEVALQPIDRFNFDAAILFSDILTIPDAMGLGLYFVEGEGPKFHKPLRTEADINELESFEDRKEFLADIGLNEPGSSVLIKKAYSLLNLQTFFTVGKKEVKAWTIIKGMTAQKSAGVIHTDFEKGFIKAEVISFSDFISINSASFRLLSSAPEESFILTRVLLALPREIRTGATLVLDCPASTFSLKS